MHVLTDVNRQMTPTDVGVTGACSATVRSAAP